MLTYSLTRDPPPRPKRLRFGLLSAEEIRRMSVCRVTETTLYYRGLPASGGLLDPLMGSVDRRHMCASCCRDARSCQGHCGHIELAHPVYHVGFLENVIKALRCICFFCTRVCATAEDAAAVSGFHGRARLNAAHALLRGRKTCPHCDAARPAYARAAFGIKCDWPEDMAWSCAEEQAYCARPFTAREALSLLTHLRDADVELLGFDPRASHPKNMIVQNLVVPPPCTRPAIYSSEGSRSRGQNDLTVKLLDCLKRSLELEAALPDADDAAAAAAGLNDDQLDRLARLQYEVFTLVSHNARTAKPPGGTTRGISSTTSKSLTERLKGKEGRVRGNLMGKRVDFSARAVITPDAYFDCDRVGVPYHIARALTVPETVNATNIRALSRRVHLGADAVHGAATVIGVAGVVTQLRHCQDRDAIVLRPGDVVERYLADDDVVIFNRQPSLHMHGMQAHRVRLMPGHTFRIALPVATPYNADFDGDEMNLHVPQSVVARTECATLMGVCSNVIGAQANKPVMGIVQDSLLGLHLLTQGDTLLDRSQACRILGGVRHASKRLPPPAVTVFLAPPGKGRGPGGAGEGAVLRRWTGKQLFAALLPPDLYVEPDGGVPSGAAVRDAELPVVVRAGRLLCGVLRKAHVGTASGGIVDVLARERGGVACMRFQADAMRLTHAYLLIRGHAVGIHDVMLGAEGQERVDERLSKATRLCEEIQREAVAEDVHADVAASAERAILRLLSKTLLQTGGLVNEYMSESNAIRRMVTAGSKGSFINLSQICAALGQQSLEGSRITASKGNRTLPCFAPNDLSLASRGMVQNSFALGLSPTETFMHGIGGREGLVDTAVKTSETGYLQRRMNKSMEDHRVFPDGTVRSANGEVVCFRWGTDGLHPARLERAKVGLLTEPASAVRARMTPAEAACALRCREAVVRAKTHVLASEFDARVLLPFHPRRLERRVARSRAAGAEARVDPAEASRRVLDLARGAPCAVGAALLDSFCAARVAHMDATEHARLLDDLEARLQAAAATPGESVGCIAAQSIGEPCTQMTLNTFHFAGVSAKNVTMGIPRLKELLNGCKHPKTPCTTLRFRAPFAASAAFAEYVANTTPLTRLGDVVARCDILDDPDDAAVPADAWMVQADALLGHAAPPGASRYVVRLELHRAAMRTRSITPPAVRAMLRARLASRACVVASEVNAVDWVVRIRFAHVREMVAAGALAPDQEAILCHRAAKVLLDTVVISGHPEVSSAAAAETTRLVVDAEGVPAPVAEHVVHAFGSCLSDFAASPCVLWEHCTSNDVWDVLHTLGVEACVHVLFDQIRAVVSFDGTYVDDRHLLMICDTICRNGSVMPLNRHGINRSNASPLMQASFEETTDVLCDAAMFARCEESTRGVTTSIMTGQLASLGSGTVDARFHESVAAREVPPPLAPPRKRVLRSTCRSHTASEVPQVLEYVYDDVRPAGVRPLSPPTVETGRKRARFRPVSPAGA